MMVDGDALSPDEAGATAGWQAVGAPRKGARSEPDSARNSKGPRRNLFKKILNSSRMPRLPKDETKVIIRPGGGINLMATPRAVITTAIVQAAGIPAEKWGLITLCPNVRQNIVVASSKDQGIIQALLGVDSITLGERPRPTNAYVAAPHDTAKGVIKGIPTSETAEEIRRKLVTDRNPTVVDAHRLGNTTVVIVLFQGDRVPYSVIYGHTILECRLYRKQVDKCWKCGRVGHRQDVCPDPTNKICGKCGMKGDPEGHPCTPKCILCGGAHESASKECPARFRTPYIIKKRQYENWQPPRTLFKEEDFPHLGGSDGRRRSRSRSRRRGRTPSKSPSNRNSRSQSRSTSRTRMSSTSCFNTYRNGGGAPQGRDKVSWSDAVSSRNTRDVRDETIENLKHENQELRIRIDTLTKAVSDLTKQAGGNEPRTRNTQPTEIQHTPGSQAPKTPTNDELARAIDTLFARLAVLEESAPARRKAVAVTTAGSASSNQQ